MWAAAFSYLRNGKYEISSRWLRVKVTGYGGTYIKLNEMKNQEQEINKN